MNIGISRRQTKKWMPTQHGGNGHVSGVESMNRKNSEKHGDWGTMRFTPHFWAFLPAIALFKGIKGASDLKCQVFGQGKDMEVLEIPNRTVTRKMGDAHPSEVNPEIYQINDMEGRRGLKSDRMSANHMASNCASDRELWQRCVKDRYNRGVDCQTLLDQFRKCQESA
jgi:hypothetical protein